MSSQVKTRPLPASSSRSRRVASPADLPSATPSPPPAPLPASTPPEQKTQVLDSALNNNKIKAQLNTLSNRFEGFEEELNLSRNRKKSEEDKRILILQTQLTNLQNSLALESKNRAMSVKALQNWLTDRIAQWTEQIEAPMTAKLESIEQKLFEVHARIDELDQRQKQDRVEFPKIIDARCNELLKEITETKIKLEQSNEKNEEKEKRILLKIQDTSNKIAAQFTADKHIHENKLSDLKKELDEECAIRLKSHEIVKSTLEHELAILRADLSKESALRTAADEDLVQAINHYAAALQDGIKIVSTQ